MKAYTISFFSLIVASSIVSAETPNEPALPELPDLLEQIFGSNSGLVDMLIKQNNYLAAFQAADSGESFGESLSDNKSISVDAFGFIVSKLSAHANETSDKIKLAMAAIEFGRNRDIKETQTLEGAAAVNSYFSSLSPKLSVGQKAFLRFDDHIIPINSSDRIKLSELIENSFCLLTKIQFRLAVGPNFLSAVESVRKSIEAPENRRAEAVVMSLHRDAARGDETIRAA